MRHRYKYKVEWGVPIPPPTYGDGDTSRRYPFKLMKPSGHILASFFVPLGETDMANIRHAAKKQGVVISIRRVEGGHRVWRLE